MKEKVKVLYLEGYQIKEIANQLGKSESSIRKIIDRNFKEIKEMRKQKEKDDFLNAVKSLYSEGYSFEEIANQLGKSEILIRKTVDENFEEIKIERKAEEKDIFLGKIKSLYLKGYNAKEISEMIGYSHTRIRRLISQNFNDLLEEHYKAREYNSSVKKSINHTINSFISDSALLKINRQSYKYNKNYNLVFDEETRGKRTDDIPKVYYRRKNIK